LDCEQSAATRLRPVKLFSGMMHRRCIDWEAEFLEIS